MKIIRLLPVLLLFAYLSPVKSANSPYIYYYSFERQAFIVERADGSDSKILVAYPMPKDHSWIEGPGWSASGKRFAWTSESMYGHSDEQNAFILNNENGRVFRFFPTNVQIGEMSWSPRGDLLMISFYKKPLYVETVVIYDAIADKILQIINAGQPNDESYFVREYWSSDGQSAFLVKAGEITVVSVKGGYRTIQAPMYAYDVCNNYGSLPHQFRDGSLAYLDPSKQALIVENSNGINPISVNLPAGEIGLVDWSPNEEYALVYVMPSETTPQYDVWLLSLQNKTIVRLLEDVYFTGDCNTPFDRTLWNSKDQSVVTTQDELWLVTPSSQKISRIPAPIKGTWRNYTPLQWTDDGHLLFIWENAEPSTDTIYAYNPISNATAPIPSPKLIDNISYFALSSNQYLAYTGGENVLVSDSKAKTQTPIPFPAPSQYGSIGAVSLYWHPTQNWFFMLSENIETEHLIDVANADGSVQRYLTICSHNPASCVGWMP